MGLRNIRSTRERLLPRRHAQKRSSRSSSPFAIGEGSVTALSILMTRWRRTASLKRNATGELGQRLAVDLDVHQHVVGFVDLGDRERELPTAPVFQAMHGAVTGRDHALVAFQHRRNLLTLVGVHQKNDLVMSHCCSLWICRLDREASATRS